MLYRKGIHKVIDKKYTPAPIAMIAQNRCNLDCMTVMKIANVYVECIKPLIVLTRKKAN